MSIQAYAGEFTISPIPLEMSMNYCSHKCAYCFANLNQPGRTFDVNGTINQIKNCHKGKGLTSFLLKEKYPILLSNRVDPFASTNYRQTISFLEILKANGNPIVFQTKGGQGVDEAIDISGKSNWYISIGFNDDALSKKIEPGAPVVSERIKLIEKLISKGHHVSVGINPLVEEWLPTDEFELLTEKLIDVGIKDYWLEILHLNAKQVGRMSEKEMVNIGDDIITEAKKRHRNDSYFRHCLEYLKDKGLNVYSMNQPFTSSYFDSYHANYKTIKTHQDFINYCFDKYPNGGEVKWQEYYDFMKEPFYEQLFSEADGYAYRIARNVYKRLLTEPIKTLKGVLSFYWENPEIHKSIGNNQLFSVLSYHEGKEEREWRCNEDNKLIYWFSPQPQSNYRYFIE